MFRQTKVQKILLQKNLNKKYVSKATVGEKPKILFFLVWFTMKIELNI